jgi:hemerythrin superfamily protein
MPLFPHATKDLTMNAIQLLKDDHKKVRALLAELESTSSRGIKTRTELLAKIGKELRVHAKIEEEIFYPAFKAAGEKSDDDKMYFEAKEEHRAVELLVLPDLEKTDPAAMLRGRAKVLKELIEHHAGEEEKEMFPRARKLLSAAELDALGARMEARKPSCWPGEPACWPRPRAKVVMRSRRAEDDEACCRSCRRRRASRANGRGPGRARSR